MLRTNNRGVAHAFVRQTAATNSNDQFFTNGRVLYSYGAHWPVAIWVDGRVKLNADCYSATTSKHASFARQALASAGYSDRIDTITRKEALILANGSQL